MSSPKYDSELVASNSVSNLKWFYSNCNFQLFLLLGGLLLYLFAQLFKSEALQGAQMTSTLAVLMVLISLFLIVMKLLYIKARDSKLY